MDNTSNRQMQGDAFSQTSPGLFGGLQFIYVQDPMLELASCPSILIRQEPDFLESITGCETPNVYHVFGNSHMGFKYLFKCIEKSECCERFFCPSKQRQFDMDIIHCTSLNQLYMGYNVPFANMQKPCMCTIGCFCRPEVTITFTGSNAIVGKVVHIYTLCDPTFELYTKKGILKYIVTASCCQCIFLFPGMIGKSYEGEFDIIDIISNQPVGKIIKEPASMSELVIDADSYTINFPPNATANDKLLLMGLTIMMDYQYFETNANNEKKKRRGRGGYRSSGGGIHIRMGRGRKKFGRRRH